MDRSNSIFTSRPNETITQRKHANDRSAPEAIAPAVPARSNGFAAGPSGTVEIGPGAAIAIRALLSGSVATGISPFLETAVGLAIEGFGPVHGQPADEIVELLGEEFHVLGVFICEDFFTTHFGEDADENVIDEHLQRRGWRETAAARLYLEGLRDSTVSLYEVAGIEPGRSLTVRDLLRGGEAVRVEEKLGSRARPRGGTASRRTSSR